MVILGFKKNTGNFLIDSSRNGKAHNYKCVRNPIPSPVFPACGCEGEKGGELNLI